MTVKRRCWPSRPMRASRVCGADVHSTDDVCHDNLPCRCDGQSGDCPVVRDEARAGPRALLRLWPEGMRAPDIARRVRWPPDPAHPGCSMPPGRMTRYKARLHPVVQPGSGGEAEATVRGRDGGVSSGSAPSPSAAASLCRRRGRQSPLPARGARGCAHIEPPDAGMGASCTSLWEGAARCPRTRPSAPSRRRGRSRLLPQRSRLRLRRPGQMQPSDQSPPPFGRCSRHVRARTVTKR